MFVSISLLSYWYYLLSHPCSQYTSVLQATREYISSLPPDLPWWLWWKIRALRME